MKFNSFQNHLHKVLYSLSFLVLMVFNHSVQADVKNNFDGAVDLQVQLNPSGTDFCWGDQVNLGFSYAPVTGRTYLFQWFVNNIPYSAAEDTVLTFTESVTTVRVEVVDALDPLCTGSDSRTANVGTLLIADIGLSDTVKVCKDIFTKRLSGLASSGGTPFVNKRENYNYLWTTSESNFTISDENTDSAAVRNVGGLNDYIGQIELQVTDSLGCVAHDTLHLKWNDDNFILLTQSVLKFCIDDLTSVDIIEFGPDPFDSFEWILSSGTADFNLVNGDKTIELTRATNAFISVIATDSEGCESRSVLSAIDIDVRPRIASLPSSLFCVDDGLDLSVDYDSIPAHPYSTQWFVDGTLYSGSIDTTLMATQNSEVVVRVTDELVSCSGTDTVNFEVNNITALIGNDDTLSLCPEEFVVELNASRSFGGIPIRGPYDYLYEWTPLDPNLSIIDVTGESVRVTNVSGLNDFIGGVQLTITDDLGCESTEEVYLQWDNTKGIVSDVDSLLFCDGETEFALLSSFGSVVLSGAYSATVIEGTAMTSFRTNELTVLDADSAIIRISSSAFDGCTYSTEVFANSKTLLFDLEAPVEACENDVVNVQVVNNEGNAIAGNAFFYDWTIGGMRVGTNDNIDFTLRDTTKIKVTVTDAKLGCVNEDSVTVLLSTPIGQIGLGEDTTVVCSGDPMTELTGTISSGNASQSTYLWETTDTRISLTDESSEIVSVTKNVDMKDIFTPVSLKFTNGFGCVNFDTTIINWQEKVQLSVDHDPLVCNTLTDTLEASSTNELNGITWWTTSPITIIGGVNDKKFVYDPNGITSDIEINISVENKTGCTSDTSITLEIQDLQLDLSTLSSTACSATSVPFTAIATGASDSLSYNWDGMSNLLNDSLRTFLISNDSVITVSVFDELTNCEAQDNFTISIEELMVDVNTMSDSICFEDSLFLEIVDITGGSGNYESTWSGGEITTLLSGASVYVQPPVSGTPVEVDYSYTVTDAFGCSITDIISVTRNAEITSILTLDTSICINTSVDIGQTNNASGGSGNFTYEWMTTDGTLSSSTGSMVSFSPTGALSSAEVTLVIQDTWFNGCSSEDKVNVDIQDGPELTLSESIQICPSTTTSIDANPNASTGVTYSWLPGLENTRMITVLNAGIYTVEATSAIGCVSFDTMEVSLYDDLNVDLVGDKTGICLSESKEIVLTGAENATSVSWSGEGREINDTIFVALPSEIKNGVLVSVQVQDVCNDLTLEFNYDVLSTPEADFEVSISNIQVTQEFDFVDNSLNTENTNYTWTLDTGAVVSFNTNTAPIGLSVNQTGTYDAQLILLNTTTLCKDTADLIVEVLGRKNILFVPNAFYPAGTVDENKRLRILGSNLSEDNFEFEIFNRWGELVYSTKSLEEALEEGWDGFTTTGIESDNDDISVFTYLLIGEFNDGTRINEGGAISLIK